MYGGNLDHGVGGGRGHDATGSVWRCRGGGGGGGGGDTAAMGSAAAGVPTAERLRPSLLPNPRRRRLRPPPHRPPVPFLHGKSSHLFHPLFLLLKRPRFAHVRGRVQSTPGVTGAVMWDSGIVLGKFLEHAVDSGTLSLRGKRVVELGAGCGLVGCIAALLGADVMLTDLPDRLKLLKKNVDLNVEGWNNRGSARVCELTWGDDIDPELLESMPDIGMDMIHSYFLIYLI
ncbi:hypothetical protein B296_00057277 [Ensete ventricosum]|uniref:Methyltransferase small domain-containing protein n=1 Tax=Ensete ventricosum TaxID=4639 RepID=A0A426XCJ8_ENSVE|nr:hypothetical protein B296_00057277 [Ensete ventricosum]